MINNQRSIYLPNLYWPPVATTKINWGQGKITKVSHYPSAEFSETPFLQILNASFVFSSAEIYDKDGNKHKKVTISIKQVAAGTWTQEPEPRDFYLQIKSDSGLLEANNIQYFGLNELLDQLIDAHKKTANALCEKVNHPDGSDTVLNEYQSMSYVYTLLTRIKNELSMSDEDRACTKTINVVVK